MKNALKIGACLVIMLMAFSLMTYFTLADEPAQEEGSTGEIHYWDGTIAESFSGGTGAKDDPFLISSPEEFAYFLYLRDNYILLDDLVTAYADLSYRLTCDLYFNKDFDCTDFAGDYQLTAATARNLKKVKSLNPQSNFCGEFDGAGHTIYNMYMTESAPLFGMLLGTVKDLHVSGGYNSITSLGGGTFATCITRGAVFSDANEIRTGLLQGCTSSMTIVSYPIPSWSPIQFSGGIAGYVGIEKTEYGVSGIHDCEYSGFLYSKAECVGGIVSHYTYAGGTFVMQGCVNRGTILAPNGKAMGGMVGSITDAYGKSFAEFTFIDCFNFGSITSTKRSTSTVEVNIGGILGTCWRVDKKNFMNCGHYGSLTGQYGSRIGGIAATISEGNSRTIFDSCVVTGSVTGKESVGGFLGRTDRNAVFDNCVFDGTVTATTSIAGGLIGYINPSQYSGKAVEIDLHSCDIRGSVIGGSRVGGLVGEWAASGYGTGIRLFGSIVTPNVTGTTSVGGVIGIAYSTYGGKNAPFSLYSSLIDTTVISTKADGAMGIFLGDGNGEVKAKLALASSSYLTGEGFRKIGYNDPVPVDTPIGYGQDDLTPIGEWDDAYMTDGTLLGVLQSFTAQPGYTNPGWSRSADGTPRYRISAYLSLTTVEKEYDGTALLTPVLNGYTIESQTVQWYQYLSADKQYHLMDEPPVIIGDYRVSVYIKTTSGYGTVTLNARITATSFDLSQLTWAYTEPFLYDGSVHSVAITNCPDIFEIQYQNNRKYNAGVYHAVATVVDRSGTCQLVGEVPVCEWTIRKIQVDVSKITWDYDSTNPPTYTGDPITVRLKGNGETLEALKITYTGQTATEVGSYSCVAKLDYDQTNVELLNSHGVDRMNLQWQILPRVLDLSVIQIQNQKVSYDTKEHSFVFPAVDLLFDIPGGVLLAEYLGAPQTEPGNYRYTMLVSLDPAVSQNYQLIGNTVYYGYLTIEKAQPIVMAVGADKVYDGKPLTIKDGYIAMGKNLLDLPLEYIYYYVDKDGTRYEVEQAIDGGTYEVVVRFEGDSHYLPAETMVNLYINRAKIELPGNVVLSDGKKLYNGEPQNLAISGLLPDEITPVYSEPRTNPGVYQVIVELRVNEQNYQPLEPLTATMTILAKEIFDDKYGDSVTVEFESGGLTSLNIKVYEREDASLFRTRSFGMFTSMKSVYRVVLRDGYEATEPEEPILIRMPLTKEMAAADSIILVKIDINNRGRYEYIEVPVVSFFDDDDPEEFACIIDRVSGQVILKTMSTDTYGIITSDSHEMADLWLLISGGIGVLAIVVATLSWIYRRKKGVPKQI